jgi:predicted permease
MDALLQDLRFALRTLARSPGFTAVAVLTLALGIGANTAVFTLVDALLLRPPPHVARPHDLLLIGRTVENEGFDTFSYPDYTDLRDQSRTLAGVAAYVSVPFHVSGATATERVRGALVSWNYFAVLGTPAFRGRFFQKEEDRPGVVVPVAVLGAGLWQRAFGGRDDVIGTTIVIDNQRFTVIGVAPPAFQGAGVGDLLDLFVPLATQPATVKQFGPIQGNRDAVWLQLFGRLAPGASFPQAREELRTLGRRLATTFPETKRGWGIAVSQGAGFDPLTRRRVTDFLHILQGAVALVLAIACANVANLLLVRGAARRREHAVRASLGASGRRLARALLVESVLLGVLGGTAGLVLAYWSTGLMRALPVLRFPGTVDLTPDGAVLSFTLAVSLVTGVLFGVVPALHGSRADLASELKVGAPTEHPRGARLRNTMVVAQVAVSLVLLVVAGLFVRTLQNAYAIDPGIATRDVLVARLDLGLQGYDTTRGQQFEDLLLRRLQALPGVQSAALALNLPFAGGFDTRVAARGEALDSVNRGHRTDRNSVTPDYFRTLGIPIVRGRGFSAADAATGPLVAVVNQALAEQLWPGQDPIGRHFVRTWGGAPLEVVGVARDVKYRSVFEERRLTFYQPLAQDYQDAIVVHLRAAGDARVLARPLEVAVRELDRDLPVYRIQTLDERRAGSLGQQRSGATLLSVFGLLALLLATIGLYASLRYAVAQRTREIGVRLALGAQGRDVLQRVLAQGVTLALIGLGLGLLGAMAVTRLVRTQLYGVTPTDPTSFVAVSGLLVIVAALASYFPARRATRIDPMVALRTE